MENEQSTQAGDNVEANSFDALVNSVAVMDDPVTENGEEALVTDADEPDEVTVEVDGDADGEDADKQADEADPLIVIKVDGVEQKIKQSQLIADAQKYRSADQRFQAAAEIRKTHETALAEVQKERELLNQALVKYTDHLKQVATSSEPDWNSLAAENPAEYVRQRHLFEQKQHELQQLSAAQAYLNAQRDADHQKQREAHVQAETGKLLEAIPAWKDKTKMATESAAVSKYLGDMGFDNEAQASIIDHRLILIANKARLYDQAVAKQKAAGGAVKPVTRSERPNTVAAQPTNKQQAAEKAFKKNPSKEALIDLLS